jgi:inositol phosphorylceramide mannosyltransferase catalytic subunit
MIPKIIHQLWIGPRPCPQVLMDTWRKMNPGWDYMLWDEKAISQHFISGLRNQKQFDEMEELCGKCDIARIEILNTFGGFFIDADSICLQPLDDFLLLNDSFTCYENEFERGNLLACGYLASTSNNELMRLLIDGVGRINVRQILDVRGRSPFDSEHRAWQLTGSGLLTSTVFKNKYASISIYPSYYFIPEHYSGAKYRGFGKSYARQLWGSTIGSPFYGYDLANVGYVTAALRG